MKRLILLAILATTSFASSSLERTWQLGSNQYLTLEAGKVSGFAGCNNFFGSYEKNGSSLKFSALSSTRKACEKPIMDVEYQFLQKLGSTKRFVISQDAKRLSLIGDGVLRLQAR